MPKVIDRDELRDGRLTLWSAAGADLGVQTARLSAVDGWGYVHWAEVDWMPARIDAGAAGCVVLWAERPPCWWERTASELVRLVPDVQRVTGRYRPELEAVVSGREVFECPSAGGEFRVRAEGEHR